ncbi:hypothetical protein JCM10207_001173 [Rhodosporidiobolus poonsookiae]
MSFYGAFRSPALDLADFLRSLANPRTYYGASAAPSYSQQDQEWEILRARQGGTKRLDFFDHDLIGPEGAVAALRAVEKSPGVTHLSLSQNQLGDDGLRELLVGLKRLRSRDIGAHLEELNLTDCGLTDVSLHLLALHLLQPNPHPPSIKHLYLNANNLSLGTQSSLTSLPEFLGSTLSSPTCSLRCLALTTNQRISASGFSALLSHLKLAAGPSQLSELRLSVTSLTPACAEPLGRWLEDPEGGARLQILALNSTRLGPAGVRRIARAVISGKASSLLHLECLANDEEEGEEWAEVNAALTAQEEGEDWSDWKGRFEVAKKRNQQVYKETRLAALGLLAKSRILLGGGAEMADPDEEDPGAFPFLRLPVELQVHVLRCALLVEPSPVAHLYPPICSSPSLPTPLPASSSASVFSSALTESQFLRVVAHAANRSTLETERRIAAAHAAGGAPSLNTSSGQSGGSLSGAERRAEREEGGWEEWYLRMTGCDRFERAITL